MNVLSRLVRGRTLLLAVFCLSALTACAELRYYLQSAQGQWDISARKQPIDEYLADDDASRQALAPGLRRVQQARLFAINRLALPASQSYTAYADVERDYAVKNLFAAGEFSTQLYSWCYPVIGCASYRGYFDEAMLADEQQVMKDRGYDTYVAKIPAYSTLGWFDDPVLNTVIDYPEEQLVSLIFHELAHQQLYVEGDTTFNESFASAVEQAGVRLWCQSENRPQQWRHYLQKQNRQQQLYRLVLGIRQDLEQIYQQAITAEEKRAAKQQRLQQAQQEYRQLKNTGQLDAAYDNWFAQGLNNAKLGTVSAYNQHVEAFLAMLAGVNEDFPAFYSLAAAIGELDEEARNTCLQHWRKNPERVPPECRPAA